MPRIAHRAPGANDLDTSAPLDACIARELRTARRCSPELAPFVVRHCLHDRSVLPRWHQDDRGRRNASRGYHQPAPAGAYQGLRVWWNRQHWLAVVVPVVLALNEPKRQAAHIAADTFKRWAQVESGYVQDQRTGRRLIVRPDVVASVMGVCLRTVQNCRRLAREVGLLVDVVHGRMLNVDECTAARRRGSAQRGLSNESALVIPNPLSLNVDFCTPTRGNSGEMKSHLTHYSPRAAREKKAAASRRRLDDGAARTLAVDLIRHIPWLRGESPRRLAPTVARFAHSTPAWTAEELAAAIATHNERAGRSTPRAERIRTRPAALAAAILRHIGEADRYLPWDEPPEVAAPCTDPRCDHGWVTVAPGTVAKCRACSPSVRAAADLEDDAEFDDEPRF